MARAQIQISSASATLPPLNNALRELFRRQVRAVVWLVVRMLLLAMVMATLHQSLPALDNLISALAGILAIGPFLFSIAQNWRWRIALGKAYLTAGQKADAIIVLKPVNGIQGMLFDPAGVGKATLLEAQRD
jgi:hypothetical protein